MIHRKTTVNFGLSRSRIGRRRSSRIRSTRCLLQMDHRWRIRLNKIRHYMNNRLQAPQLIKSPLERHTGPAYQGPPPEDQKRKNPAIDRDKQISILSDLFTNLVNTFLQPTELTLIRFKMVIGQQASWTEKMRIRSKPAKV